MQKGGDPLRFIFKAITINGKPMIVGVYCSKPSEDGGVKQDTTALEWVPSAMEFLDMEKFTSSLRVYSLFVCLV